MSNPPTIRSSAVSRLAWPVYSVAVAFILVPLVDVVANVWPLLPAESSWRYGALGLLSGFLLTPLLGLLIAMIVGAYQVHTALLQVCAWVALGCALMCLSSAVVFALDALHVRSSVPVEAHSTFDVGAAKAALKYLVVAAVLVLLWSGGRRAARSAGRRSRLTESGPQVRSR